MMTQIFTELSPLFTALIKLLKGVMKLKISIQLNLTTGSITHNDTLTNVCFYCCGLIMIYLLCQNQKYATVKMRFCISITELLTQKSCITVKKKKKTLSVNH